MTIDPFQDNPETFENTPNLEVVSENHNAQPAESKEKIVGNQTENKIVVTLKGGAGYDAPWVVIHADNPTEALNIMEQDSLKGLLQKTLEVSTAFNGGSKPKQQARTGQPAASQQPPANAGQQCPPGWTYKSGVSQKTGKPWQGYFPPQGDNSKPIFFN